MAECSSILVLSSTYGSQEYVLECCLEEGHIGPHKANEPPGEESDDEAYNVQITWEGID